jgi:ribonuclease VapC
MIAVDTSALMAIVLDEPAAAACQTTLENDSDTLVSAATLTEALIVSAGRQHGQQMVRLIDRLDWQIVPVTEAAARRIAEHYQRWGKGFHPAGLNFGDCFAYALAKKRRCPLLYVGGDFAKTDIVSAL